jgi:hypothetical protein
MGDIINDILNKGEITVGFAFQKTHYLAWIRAVKGKRTISKYCVNICEVVI